MRTIILSILLSLALHSECQRNNLIYENTFESFTLGSWNKIERCFDTSITASTTTKRHGERSARFVLHKKDTSCANLVSQLSLQSNGMGNYRNWYGLSFYLGRGYMNNSYDGVENILAFERTDTNGLAPVTIDYHGQSNMLTLVQTIKRPNTDTFEIIHWNLDSVPLNKWNDLVMEIKWSNSADGFIKVWLDDSLKLFVSGANNYASNYVKIGVDKWDWRMKYPWVSKTMSRELFIDEFRVGGSSATYLDVKPGTTLPPLPVRYTVELTGRKVNTTVLLEWGAEVGDNFNRFEVERSKNGVGFAKIGEVTKGSSNKYQFVDANPGTTNYYRLRDVNFGEPDRFSRTVVVRFEPQFTRVRVFDMTGRLVAVITAQDVQTFKQYSNLTPGVYLLEYDNGTKQKAFLGQTR